MNINVKPKNLISLILLTTLISLQVNAAPKCEDVLKRCDAALNAQVERNKSLTTQVGNYEQKSKLDEQIKADQRKELGSFTRDPIKVAAATAIAVLVIEISLGVFKK